MEADPLSDRVHAHSKRTKPATPVGKPATKRRAKPRAKPTATSPKRTKPPRSTGPGVKSTTVKSTTASKPTKPVKDGAKSPAAFEGLRSLQVEKKKKATKRSGPAKGGTTPSLPVSTKAMAEEAALARRRHIPLALAALIAVVVLVTNFPLSGILSQRHQLSAAAAQLNQVQRENKSLTEQRHLLDSNAAIQQLARQDYQLVSPGQTLYEVLPPSGTTSTTAPGQSISGDPGNQPLVDPANAPDMSPDPSLAEEEADSAAAAVAASHVASTGSKGGGSSAGGNEAAPPTSGFFSRVAGSLEFWK